MKEYEIQYQSREMLENDEWGTYHYDNWGDAIQSAWEMREDSDIIVIQVYEIDVVTFKDER